MITIDKKRLDDIIHLLGVMWIFRSDININEDKKLEEMLKYLKNLKEKNKAESSPGS